MGDVGSKTTSCEKYIRHVIAIVLAGMHKNLFDDGRWIGPIMPDNGAGYRGVFNELRAGADDGGDLHVGVRSLN